jgi:hypothetical protein
VGPAAGFELVDQPADTGRIDFIPPRHLADSRQPVRRARERVVDDLDGHRAVGPGGELGNDRTGEALARLGIAGQGHDTERFEVDVERRLARTDGHQRRQRGRVIVGHYEVGAVGGLEHPHEP